MAATLYIRTLYLKVSLPQVTLHLRSVKHLRSAVTHLRSDDYNKKSKTSPYRSIGYTKLTNMEWTDDTIYVSEAWTIKPSDTNFENKYYTFAFCEQFPMNYKIRLR